jgi:hypothetical protein
MAKEYSTMTLDEVLEEIKGGVSAQTILKTLDPNSMIYALVLAMCVEK